MRGTPGRHSTEPDDDEITVLAHTPPTLPRFAQLTYSAFHRADGSDGGWQVKDVCGGLSAQEQRHLVERVATNLDRTGKKFLTREEIEALPRRLVYAPVPGGARGYWHTVPAGTDSSGRPGNVFAHILLDRTPEVADPALRPSDLLGSPMWLRPFGADQVLASTLDGVPDPPWASCVHDRAAVVDFLADKALWRAGALAALLDAVVSAMGKGPTVVFGTEEPGSGEAWIAAVCHLMSPGTSRELFWSTAERAVGLDAARAGGLHLVVVPCSELARIEPDLDQFVLISDEAGAAVLGHMGTDHQVPRYGSKISVTPWSGIVAVVAQDRAVAIRALELKDRVAAEVGDRNLRCGWPLAMAVGAMPDQLAGAVDDAALLVGGHAPAGLLPGSRHDRDRRSLLERGLGRSAAEAWACAQQLAYEPAEDRAFTENVYLERAMGDRDWLLQPGGAPAPALAPELMEPGVVEQAHRRLAEFAVVRNGPRDRDALEPRVALRLLDMAVRARLLPGDRRGAPARVQAVGEVLDRLVGPYLLAADPRLLEQVGPVDEITLRVFVRPWFDQYLGGVRGRPGHRLAPALLGWLFPTPPVKPPPGAEIPATLAEAAAQATLVLGDPSAFRSVALGAVLSAAFGETTPGDVRRIALGAPLAIEDVRALSAVHELLALAPVLGRSIAVAPDAADLSEVLERVRTSTWQPRPENTDLWFTMLAARMRRLQMEWWSATGSVESASDLLSTVEQLLKIDDRLVLPEGVQWSVVAANVVEAALAEKLPPQRRSVKQLVTSVFGAERVSPNISAYVDRAVRNHILGDVDLVVAAQLVAGAIKERSLDIPWLADLVGLQVTTADGREPLLDNVARSRVAAQCLVPTPELVRQVRRRVDRMAQRFEPKEKAEQVNAVDHDRLAKQWWTRIGVNDEAVLDPLAPPRKFWG